MPRRETDDELAGSRILIVDDEPTGVALLDAVLAEEGFTDVRSVTDSRLVAAMCEEYQPDLILLDLNMPHVSGYEILRRLRADDSRAGPSVVVVTGMDDRQSRIKALAAGAQDLLTKPFDSTEVCVRVRNLLDMHRLTRRLSDENGRLTAVLEATHDAVAMFDLDRRPAFVNGRYRDLFGLPSGEIEDDDFWATVTQSFQRPKDVGATIDRLFADPEQAHEDTIEIASPNHGMARQLSFPVRGRQGDVIGRLFRYRDMSTEFEAREMRLEVTRLRGQLRQTDPHADIIGESPAMVEMFRLLNVSLHSDISVLIEGENGTGKDMVARALHYAGPRQDGPFVAVNCAAIPEALIESELFGHEKGSFTGAAARRVGKFESADTGTLFLDEIGDMPALLQAKLLRVLQDREIDRVGGERPVPIDVRVIAATNADIQAALADGSFRQDLYYRLAEFSVRVPPLRERKDDIPLLAAHFIAKHQDPSRERVLGVSPQAMAALRDYPWPGNVRELESVIRRALLVSDASHIGVGSLPRELTASGISSGTSGVFAPSTEPEPRPGALEEAERDVIAAALDATDYDVTGAASSLGFSRATLYRKMKKYGIPASRA